MATGLFSTCALLAILLPQANCLAASNNSWDGTWSGMLNNKEPVTVTISGGRVVAYSIRGGELFPIGFNKVTVNSVSFGDNSNYGVNIQRTGEKSALGKAHGPMGDGSAQLLRQ
jgi:hypothetical protein